MRLVRNVTDVDDDILRAARTLPDAGHALIDAANQAGGRDNITVVLLRVGPEADGATDGPRETGSPA